MDAFLSYNSADMETARGLGVQLQLTGAGIWFDEWELRAGDSIPGKVNEALARVDCVILLWSESASSSNWVRAELEAGIQRGLDEGSLRVIPVILDDTSLPPLLRPLRWVDLRSGNIVEAVNEVMGFAMIATGSKRSKRRSRKPASRSATSMDTEPQSVGGVRRRRERVGNETLQKQPLADFR